jgi:purine-binding chemotaxis protein CheW
MKKETEAYPEHKDTVNWDEIHRRMQAAAAALAQGDVSSPQERRSILRKRAQTLAQEAEQVAAGESLEIIEFRLASETYGLESRFIREVYPLRDVTPLPGMPPFVLGIVNVRGQILSVVDLKEFFNLPDKGLGQLNKLIILHDEQMEFGILADAILDVRSIALDTLQTAPATVSGIGEEYLRGVTGERMILLDAEEILRDENIVVHQEIK